MRKKPKYLKRPAKRFALKQCLSVFFQTAFDWFPLWSAPVLALAAWISLASGNIIIMAGAITCFFSAVVSSVLLMQAVRAERASRRRKEKAPGGKIRRGLPSTGSAGSYLRSIPDSLTGS